MPSSSYHEPDWGDARPEKMEKRIKRLEALLRRVQEGPVPSALLKDISAALAMTFWDEK